MKIEDGKIQGFFHAISEEKKINGFKMRFYKDCRLELCNHIKPLIENYDKCNECSNNCNIKVWTAPYENTYRTKFFFEPLDYIVIIEDRKIDYILVTAYVVDRKDRKDDILKEYKKYSKTENDTN